jgi:hypothetical protein
LLSGSNFFRLLQTSLLSLFARRSGLLVLSSVESGEHLVSVTGVRSF